MGPIDYSDLVASRKISDPVASKAPGGETVIIAWIMGCVAYPIIIFMGLWIEAHLFPIIICGFIGLGLWACGYYGTNKSLWRRLRYRPTRTQRAKVRRRLSEVQE